MEQLAKKGTKSKTFFSIHLESPKRGRRPSPRNLFYIPCPKFECQLGSLLTEQKTLSPRSKFEGVVAPGELVRKISTRINDYDSYRKKLSESVGTLVNEPQPD